MERAICYIDGFNLYFGLKSKGWKRYYWLNVQCMIENLLHLNQKLMFTKYFTARITSPSDKRQRQNTYLEALSTLSKFEIFYGKYQINDRICRRCGFVDHIPNEKMSDVNIAVELLSDAFQNKYDTAFLVTADSDLVGAVKTVQHLFPDKRVIVLFPPNRWSQELAKTADAHIKIGRSILKRSLFPPIVKKKDGYQLRCPGLWK
jgi:uncharacterized LabA/DUF88 family protein